ncbi:hypothetical protein CH333_07485 [candidate division WOR-3 bacterium JGI_Cruoil_03_44_89]|uniref:HTH marR-type domain-containing protein n=1 Tax=candidate division WOR-3 bacterium JGI_Cruoil_03_44_89 TaxID=1973748 RepID=A0A235BQB2_UNCW3|nr:MAG: hypothetical protein CH333_07485 [candidate division WOR-3 bacterium JGI_Cruoil_03_44_89]
MKSGDKISEYIDRVEKCIPKIIKSISLFMPKEIAGLRLTESQVLTLSSLFGREVWKMTELSESVNINLSAMTGVVDSLVRNELVERKRDVKDRRRVLVHLTSRGKKIARKIRTTRKRKIRNIIEYLNEDEREAIISGFEKAVKAISTRAETKKQEALNG